MTPPNATAKKPPSVLKTELLRHMPLYRKVLFFSLICNLLVLAPTIFMLEVYGRVVNSRSSLTLNMLLIMVVGAYILMEMLELVRGEVMSRAATRVDESLRQRLFDGAFETNLKRGGVGSTQVFSDLKTLRDFMPSPAAMAFMDTPASLVFLVIVFMIHPSLGVFAMMGAVVQVLVAVRTEKRTMPALTEANRAAINAQGYASGSLRNTQVIEAMGMMGSIRTRWMGMQRRFLRLQAEASDTSGTNSAVGKFIQMSQGSLILGLSCWLSLQGYISGGGGMMIVASTLGGRMLTPLLQLVPQWRMVVNARDAYARLDEALGVDEPRPEPMSLPPPKGMLTVEGVVAPAPGTNMPILKGVSFGLKPGELLVVLGPSASGKTTLARLLTGVWPATAGKVRLDSADVYAWEKDELGPHVGYLPQTVELFDGTLAENIARFGNVDMDKVRAASRMVGLDPVVEELPDRFDTRIGEDGAFLSGGQRQRVGLARALYGMPKFLVLDEPNSSLDDAGERMLVSTLSDLKAAGCTIVVMSHRRNVLEVADRLLILRDGQVAMFGPRDEVLAALQKAAQGQPPGPPTGQPQGRPLPGPVMRPAIPGAPVGGAA